MVELTRDQERRRLQEAAREYKRQGYEVVLRPGRPQLPRALAHFEPDMVAYRGDEKVVVEVKAKTSLRESQDFAALASAVDAEPGWRLDLWVADSRNTWPVDTKAEQLTYQQIRERIADIRDLLASHPEGIERPLLEEAATVLAWATMEATLRQVADQQGIRLQQRNQPAAVLKQLYSLGILDRHLYASLQGALDIRNRIVHGYRTPDSPRHVVNTLLDQVEGLAPLMKLSLERLTAEKA